MADAIAGDAAFAQGGRFVLYLHPAEATWPRAAALARSFGALAMAEVDANAVRAGVARHLGPDWGSFDWLVLSAQVDAAAAACRRALAARPLPEGWAVEARAHLSEAQIAEVYALAAAAGIAPLPPRALQGRMTPVLTLGLRDSGGTLRASACAQAMFPRDGRLGETMTIHLVAVDPAARGRGLGTAVAARTILAGADAFGLARVSAYVAADNAASRAVFAACGFAEEPGRAAVIATPAGARFTR